jgi:O-antigen/teichoic acid export membrane protein
LKAAGEQAADVRMYSVNPATNILLGAILIPAFGGTGAALSRITSVIASFALRYRYFSRHVGSPDWLRIAARPLVVSVALAGALFGLQGPVPDAVLGLLYASGVGAALYLGTPRFAERPGKSAPAVSVRPSPAELPRRPSVGDEPTPGGR